MSGKGKVGVIGLGLMGSALSGNLIQSGYEVSGFDIEPARVKELEGRGGRPASSPAGAARGAQFVITSLLYSSTVREVCLGKDGVAEAAEPGLIVIDASTSSPDDSAETARLLRERGIGFLDASLSGASNDAWARRLVAVVGGEKADFERARPVIDCFSRSVYHLGANGAGALTKLIINHVLGLNRLVLAEGLVFGMKAGVEMETLLAVLKDSAAYSKAMDQRGRIMIEADYGNPVSRVRQHHKDVRLILAQGQKLGAPMPLEQAHQQVLQAAEVNGLADADTGAIIEVLRRLAGIPSRWGG
ncbi:MAG: NAD(P)-dependent oxidoreductase [Candidatus Tectomicrobia bacterium]|uniref:NAD(P)-dependent oxidoreductase n=1 Tax=Tectimicrobiota bacterium TaxID=2528274 RepID=A0A932MP95_UNCTE|nr:NAD(P)-dependent oxidoreductase [Candidatus Tectomicrobia bacterium]